MRDEVWALTQLLWSHAELTDKIATLEGQAHSAGASTLPSAPARALDAVRGSDVRLVLCGHVHLQLFGHLASVPVWVTAGVLSRVDLTRSPGTERAVRGASTTLVDLDDPHAPLVHVLHARDRGRARRCTSSTANSSARSSSGWAPAPDQGVTTTLLITGRWSEAVGSACTTRVTSGSTSSVV